MNWPNIATSFTAPVNSDAFAPGAGREYPVIIASTCTRSVTSNGEFGLSTRLYGGAGSDPAGPMSGCFGLMMPSSSQIDAEPGPPLKKKVTGRLAGSTPSLVYEM